MLSTFKSATPLDKRGWPQRRRALSMLTMLSIALMVLAPCFADAGMATAASRSTSLGYLVHTGTVLHAGTELKSRNGQFQLEMQRDGNLVVYNGARAIWSTNTSGHDGADAVLQRDGNFVLYQASRPLWAAYTNRGGSSANVLVMQVDGDLVVYSGSGKALWSTYRPPAPIYPGDTGPRVVALQRRLDALGYWVGAPGGYFGDATDQAVFALQKAAGIPPTDVVGVATEAALARGALPTIRPASGNLVEVNLSDDLLMIIRNGKLWATLNTSTGGGYTYVSQGVTSVAITPQGIFNIYSEIDGTDVSPLGVLWRPKFFTGGYAIHGDSYVPPFPVSHGCVRVSDEAIDWIWANNIMPIGTEVWVF
ncbi:MAG: L,D-transpeptidase family protein [Acidimicrobiales bacterium]|jgi:peptidoglycan hydrolase-like protein with peptidoglycan-binding domain